jgi:hypothetical protein
MKTADDTKLLIAKVKEIAKGPHAELLAKFVNILYAHREGYDEEPLSPEELAAVQEAEEAIRQGDMSKSISLEEYESKRGM